MPGPLISAARASSPNAIAPIARQRCRRAPLWIMRKVVPCWMLTPVDHRCEIWKTYPVQRIVVDAPDEWAARKRVAEAAPWAALPNPWLDPALTSCEEVDGAPGVMTG
jgi:hypothetical protein